MKWSGVGSRNSAGWSPGFSLQTYYAAHPPSCATTCPPSCATAYSPSCATAYLLAVPPQKKPHHSLNPLLLLLLPLLTGCGISELQDKYGKRNGPEVFASVNGTAVFASMCEERGHDVFSWPVLSPRIQDRADCIVWFPDDYAPPNRDIQRWLERWLKTKPNRTLVYVGRHFDGAAWYWENVDPTSLPPEKQTEVARRRKKARRDFGEALKSAPKSIQHEWYDVGGKSPHRKISTLEGEPRWLKGIDPAKVSMETNARLIPPPDADVLLASEGDPFVFRCPVRRSQLIVVSNGSFLLNAPLSLHQHRRLAGKLIDEIGTPKKTIAFLEFDLFGPYIVDKDPTFGPQLGFQIFHIWPTNWILLHVCLLGILLCFWRFPIFGRPVEPETASSADFGVHIDAVARLLAKSGDAAYARTRLQHYRQTARIETVSHSSSHKAVVPVDDRTQAADLTAASQTTENPSPNPDSSD